jgi:hypothetical protein
LHDNHLGLIVVERVLQAIAEQHDEWHAFAHLVRACRWPRGEDTPKLVEHPLGWGKHTFQMLLGSTCHGRACFLLKAVNQSTSNYQKP